MAVEWKWDCKQGEIYHDKWVMDIYGGNAMLIAMYRTDKDGVYQMPPIFFNDKTHAKRMLGLAKGFDDIFEGNIDKIVLYRDKWDKKPFKDIVELFAEAYDDIEIIIKKEAPQNV